MSGSVLAIRLYSSSSSLTCSILAGAFDHVLGQRSLPLSMVSPVALLNTPMTLDRINRRSRHSLLEIRL